MFTLVNVRFQVEAPFLISVNILIQKALILKVGFARLDALKPWG